MRPPPWWTGALAVAVLLGLDIGGQAAADTLDPQAFVWFGAVLVTGSASLLVWARRPESWQGGFMVGWLVVALLAEAFYAFPDSRLAATIGWLTINLAAAAYVLMVLAYPTGRVALRSERLYIYALFTVSLLSGLPELLFTDLSGCGECTPRTSSYFYIGPSSFDILLYWQVYAAIVLAFWIPGFVFLVLRRARRLGGGARRTVLPLYLAAAAATIVYGLRSLALVLEQWDWMQPIAYADPAMAYLVPVALAWGVLATKRARGAVGDLVVELGHIEPGGVRDALARAVGDPTLELVLRLPDRDVWVDEHGVEVSLPTGPERAVTFIGEGIAAVVHDPDLAGQRGLIEAAGSAARLALENERLQAELRAQLAELRASRARIVRAGDDERRRLERDLHDGAQQRLLGLGLALQLAQARVPDGEAAGLLAEAKTELDEALSELRQLARGIHPAILVDQGLAPAIRTLADRSPVPIDVTAPDGRLPLPVETAAYFVVAEGLANVAKYAGASRAWVSVERIDGHARVLVGDDGRGGARIDGGSGLRGLADRVGALDGRLAVESPAGGGTRVVAEIPCE